MSGKKDSRHKQHEPENHEQLSGEPVRFIPRKLTGQRPGRAYSHNKITAHLSKVWKRAGSLDGSPRPRASATILDLDPFGAGREHFVAVFCDEDGVFDADAADVWIVEAWLDGDDVSGA